MDPMFTAGGPGRVSRWLRTYRVPVLMTALFGLALAGLALVPRPNDTSSDITDRPARSRTRAPEHSPCIACPLGKKCDASGQCVFEDTTPPPCEKGTSYDEEEGFCLPDPTAKPTAPPTKTLAPGAVPRSTPRPSLGPSTGPPTPQPTPVATPREPATPKPATPAPTPDGE